MAASYAARGPHGVGVTTLDLVDASRGTAANRDAPASPDRRFTVEAWYPAAPSAEPETRDAPIDGGGGRYPLLIFAHGYSSFRRQSATYAQHLASHGYVVAAPDFPQSRIDTPGGPRLSAVLDQPADVSFIIDQMLARDADPAWALAGGIDAGRVGVTGHSLGGMTTMLVAFGERRDARVKAALPISPPGCLLPATLGAGSVVPAMIVGGSAERIVDPKSIARAYDEAGTPRYFVEIIGADHTRFTDFDITDAELGSFVEDAALGDAENDAETIARADGADINTCRETTQIADALISGDRQRELLRTSATPFFDAYLRDDADALRFLREALPSLAGLRVREDLE